MQSKVQPSESGASPRLLSISEAADYMGVSYKTVADWVQSKKLAVVMLPGRREDGDKERRTRLVDVRDLDAMIEAAKSSPEIAPTAVGESAQKRRNTLARKYPRGWYVSR
jgi:excisionase family DNA binding protein